MSTMLLPSAPALFNLFIVNATLERLSSVRQSCLADRFYGTYDDQSLFMVDSHSHCDPSELKLDLSSESNSIFVHPGHELLFLKKTDIEDPVSSEDTLLGILEHLGAHATTEPPTTPDEQLLLTENAPMYSIPYLKHHSALLSISPHLLPHFSKALPPSYKAYALPKLPLPFRRVPDEVKGRIRHWTHSMEYDDEISWVVGGLSISQLREDVRYLTGEDSNSPILSRNSFSEGGRLAAEWIFEQIEETGAECELKRFLPGFAPNVIWSVASHRYNVDSQENAPFIANTNPWMTPLAQ